MSVLCLSIHRLKVCGLILSLEKRATVCELGRLLDVRRRTCQSLLETFLHFVRVRVCPPDRWSGAT